MSVTISESESGAETNGLVRFEVYATLNLFATDADSQALWEAHLQRQMGRLGSQLKLELRVLVALVDNVERSRGGDAERYHRKNNFIAVKNHHRKSAQTAQLESGIRLSSSGRCVLFVVEKEGHHELIVDRALRGEHDAHRALGAICRKDSSAGLATPGKLRVVSYRIAQCC